ncbi:MAG: BrnT family toxin [Bacteroidetes bacterium]|nr:BrnT family toxin [Bacteroidota bacterium]
MNIIWDDEKNATLKKERNISFEEIEVLILDKKYLDIVEHPKRPNQKLFILSFKGYIHVVPFVIDTDNNIVLKTAFPSTKFNKIYGQKDNEN